MLYKISSSAKGTLSVAGSAGGELAEESLCLLPSAVPRWHLSICVHAVP